jgi:hypothetical protein
LCSKHPAKVCTIPAGSSTKSQLSPSCF